MGEGGGRWGLRIRGFAHRVVEINQITIEPCTQSQRFRSPIPSGLRSLGDLHGATGDTATTRMQSARRSGSAGVLTHPAFRPIVAVLILLLAMHSLRSAWRSIGNKHKLPGIDSGGHGATQGDGEQDGEGLGGRLVVAHFMVSL